MAQVLGALLRRDMLTRFGRHNIGFLWLFADPMLFIVTFTVAYVWMRGMSSLHGLNIMAFFLTGYSAIFLVRNSASAPGKCIRANRSLMHHRNVRIMSVYLSGICLEVLGGTIAFLTLGAAFICFGWMDFPQDILKLLFGWALVCWFGTSLGLTVAPAIASESPLFKRLWALFMLAIFPLSGAMSMNDWLPNSFQDVIYWMPMVHGVELMREGYFGMAVHAHYDLAYASFSCLVLTVVGMALNREVERNLRPG